MTSLPDRPFGLADLAALDLTRDDLRSLARTGAVRRVLRGVYVATALGDSLALRAQCAAYVLPEHCVVSDRSAAWLHGVDAYALAPEKTDVPLDVVALAGHTRTVRRDVRGAERDLSPSDVMQVHGVRVTTPLRTACDVASLQGRLSAMAVLDSFSQQHGITPADLRSILPRLAGRRGVKQLRELSAYLTDKAESPSESWTRLSVIDAGFPPPTPQVWVYLPDIGWVRLDMGWEELKIAVEYDGEEFHTSPGDREHDRRRREALARAGWIVIVIRKDDFRGAGLDRWVGELRAAFAERRPARPAKHAYSRGESYRRPGRAS